MRNPRGFTLVELLVASLLAGSVLSSIYFVFISNSRQYYTQEQIVQMQESMRFGLEYLKNDLRNAGQLAIVNGTATNTDALYCGPKQANLRAIDLTDNTGAGAAPDILGQLRNSITPDQVSILSDASQGTLMGARYDGATIQILASAEQTSASAMRIAENAGRFGNFYKVGYFLRLLEPTGKFDLVPISAVSVADRTITLARAPTCVAAAAENLRVNPVQFIRYRIVADGADRTKTSLEREVLNAETALSMVPPDKLTVAEFVVNLQVWGTYDSRPGPSPKTPSIADDPRLTDDIGNWTPAAVQESAPFNATPHRIRALNVLLATRSNREDPDMHLAADIARAANARIAADRTWFDVVEEGVGVTPTYARVTTLTARVETPNLLTENDL